MNIRHEKITTNITARLKENWSVSFYHWHQRTELAMVERGSFQVTIQGNQHTAHEGDVLTFRSGQLHDIRALTPGGAVYITTIDPKFLNTDLHTTFLQNYIPKDALEAAGIYDQVRAAFLALYREATQRGKHAEPMLMAHFQILYILLSRHFELETNPLKTMDTFLDFQNVLTYISDNFREHIDLTAIAGKLNYSPSYVSAMFVAYTGMNYKVYLDNIRIREASELLLNTNITISDISSQCGFENIRTFNNVFRRITGMTPSQFRNRG